MKQDRYDVIVVGAGHAGVEAAHAAWRMGLKVALATFRYDDIGVMSCNPAIGGLGKGHLVREIDALDGLMGRVADKAAIQFRLLNRRKGPAVRGPRVQADRDLYRAAMQAEIEAADGLSVIEGEVIDLIQVPDGTISGIEMSDNQRLACSAVILTSGTFLKGVMHIGLETRSGGRKNAAASTRLADRIRDLGLVLGRLKTGTPPRLRHSTINYDGLDQQPGDDVPTMFSFLHSRPFVEQVCCAITHTNEKTHDIIRDNLDKSAIYGGTIKGVGPRYCPSIEDKVVRFSDKLSHQIFLEPEGLSSDLVYPNGISTSLPATVQQEYVRSIRGLEDVEIVQLGYAIEYDFVDPKQLNSNLGLSSAPGLFLAGQINGTTGYEEAAAQGLIAGIAAAEFVQGVEPTIMSRANSYIGVMLDDLTTRGVTEPYRMFTSRAEYRLLLRADNADLRLTDIGIQAGCVGKLRATAYRQKCTELEQTRARLAEYTMTQENAAVHEYSRTRDRRSLNGLDVLEDQKVDTKSFLSQVPAFYDLDPSIVEQLRCDLVYRDYIDRQQGQIEAVHANEALRIPPGFDFFTVDGISSEIKTRLCEVRPESLGQASRMEGVTPAAIVTLLAALKRDQRRTA